MLGSDPIAALLGAGIDSRAPQVIWKGYLRRLVANGAAVVMMAPDITVPEDADDSVLAKLAALLDRYPPGTQMPEEVTGRLAGANHIDADAERVNLRVGAYYRHMDKVLGKDLGPALRDNGIVSVTAGLHVGCSRMAAVIVPDAAALTQWRDWAAATSGDLRERHTAPTLLLPGTPGGGVYLFRTTADQIPVDVTMSLGRCTISTGDVIVPIPPSRQGGVPVTRLGPCRMLPTWLAEVLIQQARSVPVAVAG